MSITSPSPLPPTQSTRSSPLLGSFHLTTQEAHTYSASPPTGSLAGLLQHWRKSQRMPPQCQSQHISQVPTRHLLSVQSVPVFCWRGVRSPEINVLKQLKVARTVCWYLHVAPIQTCYDLTDQARSPLMQWLLLNYYGAIRLRQGHPLPSKWNLGVEI